VFVLNLIYRSVDHLLALQIASIVHLDSGQFFQSFFPILVGCAIWVPYFLVSKRVKATFRF
jgi:hypothetical protein